MKRPVYRLTINETDEGMDFVGLVDSPAHQKTWITMSATPKKFERYQFNEEKRIVRGVVLSTNQLIYRRDPDGFEYDVYFTKADSQKILEMFASKGYHNNVNFMHDMNQKVQDAALIEMLTINDQKSNIPEEFANQNLQPGSIIFSYKIKSDKTWKFIKENGAGFSLEGWFREVEVKFKSKNKKNQMKKSLLERLGFSKKEPSHVFDSENKDKYMEATTVDGQTVSWDGELAAGTPVFVLPAEGEEGAEPFLAPEGELSFEYEGTLYVVQINELGEIESVEEGEGMEEEGETEAAMQAMKADYEAKLAKQESQIVTMAKEIDDLSEFVEKLADKAGFKVIPGTGGDNTPAWKKMKEHKKNTK